MYTQQAHNQDGKTSTEKQEDMNKKQKYLRAVCFEHVSSSKQIYNSQHTNESIIKALNSSISLKIEFWKHLELPDFKKY